MDDKYHHTRPYIIPQDLKYELTKKVGVDMGRVLYKPDTNIHVLHDVAYYDLLTFDNIS